MTDPKTVEQLETLARDLGLDFYPVQFEEVPESFMMEVAVYGLPIRMPHWSFGVRYIHQLIQHRMGLSRIFEVVFPGNPGKAYLSRANKEADNLLVIAHVLGHADFSKRNFLFKKIEREISLKIVERAAEHAHRIEEAILKHGQERVERVLDAALALEPHIDFNKPLNRPRYPSQPEPPPQKEPDPFQKRFLKLVGETEPPKPSEPEPPPIPPHPEYDLLWFIAHYAPLMEDWERDIFLAVREESFYFYPVFSCQIMNEGWASYWHARILREADFIPQAVYLEAMKTHSDVVRPWAGEQQATLSVNPYHLGFVMWERIIEQSGFEEAKRIAEEEDDFGFIRNHLDRALIEELKLFLYRRLPSGEVRVLARDPDRVREAILRSRFNFGAPRVYVEELKLDGTLILGHDVTTDGRGLEEHSARKVLEYIGRVWRRPIQLITSGPRGRTKVIEWWP